MLQNYLHQLTKHPFLCTLLDYFLACSHRVNCQHESNKKLCICKNWNSFVQYKMPFHCLTTACAQRRREENMYGSFTNDVNQRFGFIDSPHLQSREYFIVQDPPYLLYWTSLVNDPTEPHYDFSYMSHWLSTKLTFFRMEEDRHKAMLSIISRLFVSGTLHTILLMINIIRIWATKNKNGYR